MTLANRLFVAFLLALAGCTNFEGTAVLVTVNAAPSLTLKRLSADASSGGKMLHIDVPLTGTTIPPAVTFVIEVPKTVEGEMRVDIEAFDAAEVSIAKGSGTTSLAVGQVREVHIDLVGMLVGGDAGPDLAGADAARPDLGGPGDAGETDLANADLTPPEPTTLELVAGAIGGAGNTDGIGASARFDSPYAVASDGLGNLIIADSNNQTLRKVVAATGSVTTLAGLPGTSGTSDGSGSVARFNLPRGLTSDGAGNVYIADTANHTIRKVVTSNGAVTTLAGMPLAGGTANGTGTGARFTLPRKLVYDGNGNLFVADTGNHAIRKVVISTGVVSAFLGSPGTQGNMDGTGTLARLSFPEGITIDQTGVLFIADTGNHVIRFGSSSATPAFTTFAGLGGSPGTGDGTGTGARFQSPRAVSSDRAGNVYVADSGNCAIRKITYPGQVVSLIAGSPGMCGSADASGTLARFANPVDVLASTTDVIIVDELNHSIRRLALPMSVSTMAGTAPNRGSMDGSGAAARFNQPSGVFYDGAGIVYVADAASGVVRKVVLSSGAVSSVSATNTFINFRGLAVDGSGNLFVSDTQNHVIRKVVLSNGAVSTLAGVLGSPGGGDGTGSGAQFRSPSGMTYDGGGNLYVTEEGNHTVRRVATSNGEVTLIAGSFNTPGTTDDSGTLARFRAPHGITIDKSGNLYVADTDNHVIRQVVIASGAVTTVAGLATMPGDNDGVVSAARFRSPLDVAWDGAGNLFIADTGNRTVRKLVLATGAVTTPAGVSGFGRVSLGALPAGFSSPAAIAVVAPNDLIVVDSAENAVLRIH